MKLLNSMMLALTLVFNLTGCTSAKTAPPTNAGSPGTSDRLVGDYQYSGFDDQGVKIISGRLTIIAVKPRKIGKETQIQIKGNWELKELVHRERIGRQTGTGELIGSIVDGEIILDLNPNMSDANVILKGKLEGNRLHGTWSFNGYAGPLSKGTFEATKE